MKSKILTTYHIGLSLFLISYTVLILSCSGCKSSNLANTTATPLPNKVPDTVQVVKSPAPDDSILYVNDTTHMYKDITIFHYLNTGPTIIKFPNGKTLSEEIDNPIIKDIPKQFIIDWDHIKSSPTYGVIDIRKMDMKTKKKWFSKMDGMRHINKLTKGFYRSEINANYINRGIILKYTFIEVEEEIELNEDDWIQAYVGNVGVIEAYDLDGSLLYEIHADEYGGSYICATEDYKYIMVFSQGIDESDWLTFKQASISVFQLSDGKLIKVLLMPDYTSPPGCGRNVSLWVGHYDSDTMLRIIILIEKNLIKTMKFHRDKFKDYRGITEDGDFEFKDGIVYTNGSSGFNQYTFDEWNKQMSKKENLND